MESWQTPVLSQLPGEAVPLRLYDTARGGVFDSVPHGPEMSMYVCGITPYDATHLGHAATMVTFDVVNRVWRDNGYSVNYVQNVTDVDEPLFERAQRDGEDWIVLGLRETALFREDMEALSIIPPRSYIGAIESMKDIIALVERLSAVGMTYRIDDDTGDIYFPVTQFSRFGVQSHYDRDTMLQYFAERGGDPGRVGKKDQLDALLWRSERPGEPSWPSPFGRGRPGWHVECTAIAMRYLGEQIDVQGGGNDLIFPHHEMSIAHAEAASEVVPFARHCVHTGMIGLDGDKMSKSKGNLVFVSRLRADGVESAVIRAAVLDGHYRDDRDWNRELLESATSRLRNWREAAAKEFGPSGLEILAKLRARLSDDLDTAGALKVIDGWAEAAIDGDDRDARSGQLVSQGLQSLLGITL